MTTAPLLRQVALMSGDLEGTCAQLERELGVSDPYADPALAGFGLRNALYSLGTGFLEVCSPVDAGSAGQRHLDRNGDSGYMLIFQVPDLDEAERRVQGASVRVVHRGAGDGIRAVHLHPKDVPGVIASLDEADPPEAWPWAGPAWTRRTSPGAPGQWRGATVGVTDLDRGADVWSRVLGSAAPDTSLPLAVGHLQLREEPTAGLLEVAVALPAQVRRGRDGVEVCGVRFVLTDLVRAA